MFQSEGRRKEFNHFTTDMSPEGNPALATLCYKFWDRSVCHSNHFWKLWGRNFRYILHNSCWIINCRGPFLFLDKNPILSLVIQLFNTSLSAYSRSFNLPLSSVAISSHCVTVLWYYVIAFPNFALFNRLTFRNLYQSVFFHCFWCPLADSISMHAYPC